MIKKHHIKFWAGILLAQFILFYIGSKLEVTIKLFELIFEQQKSIHQQLFAGVPFSVGDVFYVVLGVVLLYFLIKICSKRSRSTHLVKLLILLNILYFLYQIFWGMLYFQKPISESLPPEEVKIEEVEALATKYLEICKTIRPLVNEDKRGVFTISNYGIIQEEIIQNQAALPAIINPKKGIGIINLKPSLYGRIMSYTSILGYYNPFTSEAQYNAQLPATFLPFTFAHESAHQMGYAREQEANFIGYLVGSNSDNLDLRYSTDYFVLKSLLNALAEKNPKFVNETLNNYSPAMKRDRANEKLFVKQHEGLLDIVFTFTNDLFLKSNRQDGSITYSYFTDLLVRYERLQTQ